LLHIKITIMCDDTSAETLAFFWLDGVIPDLIAFLEHEQLVYELHLPHEVFGYYLVGV